MAPIFVGSNSDDTRIRSNRVGLAASTSDPGTASEGDIYYDSTNNKVKTYDGSAWSAIKGSGTVEVVASGALSNGQTVIIQSDGTVTGIATTGATQAVGSESVFEGSNRVTYTNATFDSNNNKVVIAYTDQDNSYYGTAVVGTVTGTAITFGSPVVFEHSHTKYPTAEFDSNVNKVVMAYEDSGEFGIGKACVGTVSGDSITFGTPVTFENSDMYFVGTTFDTTNNKIIICYNHESSGGRAIVGTVNSGSNTISFGSPVNFLSATATYPKVTYDSSNEKIVVVYRHNADSGKCKVKVGTVSGSSISFGSAVECNSSGASYTNITYDSFNEKVVVTFMEDNNNNAVKALVGTVSGNSITFGDTSTVNVYGNQFTGIAYDSNARKVVITYEDGNDDGSINVGTVSGTSISFGSTVFYNTTNANYVSAAFDSSNNKVVVSYEGTSDDGTAVVFQPGFFQTNLTSENFIGFSDAAYSDGDTANIQIISSIDDAQSGLTTGSKFYVQNDGTLGTTAGDPSVLAGTAVSGTEILIKQ